MWLYWFSMGDKFNQAKCKEFNLDVNDIYVLSYLHQLCDSGKAKFEEHNGLTYFLITYRKLEEDCVLTYWKAQNYRKRINYYCSCGLMELYKPNKKTPKTFFRLNLKPLLDDDKEFQSCFGQDKSLEWYSKITKQTIFHNNIQYCSNLFRYYSSGIIYKKIIDYNASEKRAFPKSNDSFAQILKITLKRCLETKTSKEVLEKYFYEQFNVTYEPSGHIQLRFLGHSPEAILFKYRFAIERAICDAFLYICRDVDVRQQLGMFNPNL